VANPAVVQSSVVAMTAAQATVAPTLAGVVAGNALALAVFDTSRTSGYAATGVAGAGATWYRGPTEPCATGVVEWWYGVRGTGGSITVTATMTGSDTAGAFLAECSGVAIEPAIDTLVLATIATGSSVTPSITPIPTILDELILVASLAPSTETASPASPYTTYAGPLTGGAQRCGIASWVNTTLTGNAASWTCTTGVWAVAAIALKPLQPIGYEILNDSASGTNAAVFAPQASPDYVDSVITAAAAAGSGVLSGCEIAPNLGTDLKFQVGVGTVLLNWSPVAVAAATGTVITAASGANPRRDLVYVNYAGTVTYVAGTAAAVPCIPTLPQNCVALAVIDVPTSATVLDTSATTTIAHVIDKRVLLGLPMIGRDYYLQPTGTGFETFARTHARALGTGGSTTQFLSAIYLPAGFPVGHLSYCSSTTAASTPTHWWFSLHDSSLKMLAVTADQTTTAWATNTLKSLAIATTATGAGTVFVTTYSGLYYVAYCITATTLPAMVAADPLVGIGGVAPTLAIQNSTNPGTIPAFPYTATNSLTTGTYWWAEVSI
jgi:hypothetical protein